MKIVQEIIIIKPIQMAQTLAQAALLLIFTVQLVHLIKIRFVIHVTRVMWVRLPLLVLFVILITVILSDKILEALIHA